MNDTIKDKIMKALNVFAPIFLGDDLTDAEIMEIVSGNHIIIVSQPDDIVGRIGEYDEVTVEAEGAKLRYSWYYRNPYESTFKLASQSNTYGVTIAEDNLEQEFYCIISDVYGHTIQTETKHVYLALEQEDSNLFG